MAGAKSKADPEDEGKLNDIPGIASDEDEERQPELPFFGRERQ